MSFLTRMSLKNRLVVSLLTIAVGFFGVVATSMLRQELLPPMANSMAYVVASVPAGSPESIDNDIAEPLSTALSAIGDVDKVSTTSSSGTLFATVEWPFDADYDKVIAEIRAAADSVKPQLPASGTIDVSTSSVEDMPVVQLAVSSDVDAKELASALESQAVPALSALAGVEKVTLGGQSKDQVTITLRPADLLVHEIEAAAVSGALEANNLVVPAGESSNNDQSLSVEVGSTLADLNAIMALPISTKNGPIPLSSVADVVLEPVAQSSLSRVNGEAALTLSVTKTQTANVVSVSHAVSTEIEALTKDLPAGIEFTVVFDQAPFIEQSIHDLSVEGGLGLLFAVLVILAFLGSFRSTIIAAVSIPLSLLITMVGLLVGEFTLNILTLGALTIAVGRVVDDSIVVIENIRRRQGSEVLTIESIVASVKQVAGAISASTITTVAVFLPIAFVSGVTGQLFRPFAVTVTIALLASLVVALTIVPVLAYWFLRQPPKPVSAAKAQRSAEREAEWAAKHHRKDVARRARTRARRVAAIARREAKGMAPLGAPREPAITPLAPGIRGESDSRIDGMQRAFIPILAAAIRHSKITIAAAVALLLVTFVVMSGLRTDFLGEQGETTLNVSQAMPLGTGLGASDGAAAALEDILGRDSDVKNYLSSISAQTGDGPNISISVTLKDGTDVAAATKRLEATFDQTIDGEVTIESAGAAFSNEIEVAIQGNDVQALSAATSELSDSLAALDSVSTVRNDLSAEQPILRVEVNRSTAATFGFTQSEIGQAIAAAIRGNKIGTISLEGTERDIILHSRPTGTTPADIAAMPLPVSALQQQQAIDKASKELEARQEAMTAEAKAKSEQAQSEALTKLRDDRAKAATQLDELQGQLEQLQNAPIVAPPAVPVTPEEQALVDAAAERAALISQLSEGVSSLSSSIDMLDEQIDQMLEQESEAATQQAETDSLTEAQKNLDKVRANAITVADVATVTEVKTAASIVRSDGVRQVTLFAMPKGGDLGAASTDVATLTDAVELPDGVTLAVAGASAEQDEAFAQLGLAMLLAIILVTLVMVATFRSLAQPFVLLASVPLAATGAVFLLVITDTPLGMPAMIGLLMLIGIVVTNAIVLIDLVNKLREDGVGLYESVIHGARIRLRPILMTAAATIFALVPMGLGLTGGGLFISKPLAIVVIGGLVSSTVLTLVVVPVLYLLVEGGKERRAAKRIARRQLRAERKSLKESARLQANGETAAEGANETRETIEIVSLDELEPRLGDPRSGTS